MMIFEMGGADDLDRGLDCVGRSDLLPQIARIKSPLGSMSKRICFHKFRVNPRSAQNQKNCLQLVYPATCIHSSLIKCIHA
jgi:hypothetical protein